MGVHNHGPDEGLGLDCNELRLPDGSLKGQCIVTLYDLMIVATYNAEVKLLISQYARFGIYVTEKDFSANPEWVAGWYKSEEDQEMTDDDRFCLVHHKALVSTEEGMRCPECVIRETFSQSPNYYRKKLGMSDSPKVSKAVEYWFALERSGLNIKQTMAALNELIKSGLIPEETKDIELIQPDKHDDNTMAKVYQALDEVGLDENKVVEAVNIMQNSGILFRERE